MELRRFTRARIDLPLLFVRKDHDEFVEGLGRDLSLGGMFIETALPADFNAEIVVHVQMPDQPAEFALPAVVRWRRKDGMGIQFRMLGARETHAITEIVRARQP